MSYLYKHLKLFVLLICLFFAMDMWAAANDELIRLEAEMLKYMDANDREAFTRAAEQLLEASKEAEDERIFYKAWGHQGIYEATHQNYESAFEIAQKMIDYARQEGSIYGEYAGMHTRAMTLLEQSKYDESQKAFLDAINFRRRHFPNESAAEDLGELIKIAYYQGDILSSKKYCYQLLAEPNVTPHHKGRTLYRLSTMAFEENNAEEFNHIYDEMNRLAQTNGIKTINLFTEVNYYIINADYKQALLLVDRLSVDTCAERKALIYHRLGDDEKAYEYMALFKHISDSLQRLSHNRDVASLYLRLNNDRLRLERELLSNQNNYLRYRFYFAVAIILILVLLFIAYQRHKIIRLLKNEKRMLVYGKKDMERSLKDLHELSFYESKADMPLNIPVNINRLCNHLTNVIQKNCHQGVTTIFQSEFPDDFEILTNPDASEDDLHVNQWEPYEESHEEKTVVDYLQNILNYLNRNGLAALHTSTQIIIAPGYKYHIVKRMVTNFHQPQSTLLLLVSAFVGRDEQGNENWRKIYRFALSHDFRFLSYGDSSILIPS